MLPRMGLAWLGVDRAGAGRNRPPSKPCRPGSSRVARDKHRPLAGTPTPDPGGLAGALNPGRPALGNYLGRSGADPAD